ncbi:MAG: hypothetical protein V3S24_10545, partial [Candidatus Tectomicrobia bacterium]
GVAGAASPAAKRKPPAGCSGAAAALRHASVAQPLRLKREHGAYRFFRSRRTARELAAARRVRRSNARGVSAVPVPQSSSGGPCPACGSALLAAGSYGPRSRHAAWRRAALLGKALGAEPLF